jgi:hypothetical protein
LAPFLYFSILEDVSDMPGVVPSLCSGCEGGLQGGRFAQSFELGGSLVLFSLNFSADLQRTGLLGPVPLQVNRPYLG